MYSKLSEEEQIRSPMHYITDEVDGLLAEECFEIQPKSECRLERNSQGTSKTGASSSSDQTLLKTTHEDDLVLAKSVIAEEEEDDTFEQGAYEETWRGVVFNSLPQWLQDNEYLVTSHRPPMPSFWNCFCSIFRIHTETGNIWTHLLGCGLYVGLATYYLWQPSDVVTVEGKVVFCTFFGSIIFCLAMSSLFHTVTCHSEYVESLFRKMDYCGIAILIMGSCISWLYYGFYSDVQFMMVYFALVFVLGIGVIVVAICDLLSGPSRRWHRAIMFSVFGLSAGIPALHYMASKGFFNAVYHDASIGWLCLSGALYLCGGAIYALRVPECYFPGTFDIWCQSHQIFHLLVVIAAFVHYCAIYHMMFCSNLELKFKISSDAVLS